VRCYSEGTAMSDLNLLRIGCVVSFIVLGGFYVYIREGFVSRNVDRMSEVLNEDDSKLENSGVA
jgi:hypothetical protein